jgi:hypothetical protein
MGGESGNKDSTSRRVLRALGWAVSVPWALMWTAGMIAVEADPATAGPMAATLVAYIVGLLPCLPFWIVQARRLRRRAGRVSVPSAGSARPMTVRNGAPSIALPPPRDDQRLALLPASIRDEWQRLVGARDLVHGFAEEGWVEHAALLDVDNHIARLRRLLEADERTNRLGGAASSTLLRQVEELTSLLVALADEAVDHQASLAHDDPVPVTLAEAKERLKASTQAYRDLQQPG